MFPRTDRTEETPSTPPEAADGRRDGRTPTDRSGAGSDGRPEAGADGQSGAESDGLTRRSVMRSAAATTAAVTPAAASASAAGDDGARTVGAADADADALTGVRGANYTPSYAYTMYQVWADYDDDVVERELDYAADLGLDSLRVWASYYYWREDGPAFFARVEHFLASCAERGIRPVVVLFESPGNEPTEENRTEDEGYATHSPSRTWILGLRNWDGWARSPRHFTRRWAQEFSCDDRLLATEVMNEPGKPSGGSNRVDFANAMLDEVVQEAPDDPTLTMGTKTVDHVKHYDGEDFDGPLDVHQFHHNLPVDEDHMRSSLREAQAHRERAGKPVYCTEWQRTRAEPPSRFQPNLQSLAATMRAAHDEFDLDGDYFWQLMLKRAYLEPPRRQGRYNGLFRANGVPFDTADYHALRGGDRHLPESWYDDEHSYPEPDR